MNREMAIAAFLLLGACAQPDRTAAPVVGAAELSCPSGGSPMTGVTLFFGLALPGGGTVSDEAWRDFMARDVTPRFPDGLSIMEAAGQWKSRRTGVVAHERARALLIWMTPSPEASRAIDAIRAAYKARFRQESVMRIDEIGCVDF